MNADDKQIGGYHYRNQYNEQHWTIMAKCDADYFAGAITKYVHRFIKKNGLQDLEKALHFIEKAEEVGAGDCTYPRAAEEWIYLQHYTELSCLENSLMRLVLHDVLVANDMSLAKRHLQTLIGLYAASEPQGHGYVNQD